jgi:hypothetical protein
MAIMPLFFYWHPYVLIYKKLLGCGLFRYVIFICT